MITLEDNIRIRTFKPPSGFDPLSATPSELEQHGFPARPDHPRLLKLYQRVFTRLKGRLNYVEPRFRVSRDESRNRASPAGVFTGDNWSGGVVQPPPGRSFQQVLGHWIVPNTNPIAGRILFNSYWIGLDGFVSGTGEALQAGVDCVTVGTSKGTFYAWVQWAPSPKRAINVAVSAGDLVMVNISAAPGAGATSATISFANITSGAATSFTISAPPSHQLAGNSAEWIVEAPGGIGELADYGQVFFDDCTACLAGGSGGAGGGTGQKLDITQGSNVISEATLITPLGIQCRYSA
jgi:hypothetical protein